MLDLFHTYARLHGPRAVRVIHRALTEEAARHDEEIPSVAQESDETVDADYGTCTVPASPSQH